MIKERLTTLGIKCTKPRIMIYDIVSNANSNATIKYIQEKCNKKVDKATIYRVVELYIEKNIFTKKVNYDNEIYYELHETEHIHYINCIKCHKKTKIDTKQIEELEKKIIANNNYKIVSHEIEFSGICRECENLNK